MTPSGGVAENDLSVPDNRETGSRVPILLLGMGATAVVLAFFAIDTSPAAATGGRNPWARTVGRQPSAAPTTRLL